MIRLSSTQDSLAQTPGKLARIALWLPGLLVALGAAVATAHGLYEAARAAGAPPMIAGLYPLITDGLALVAYAATTRLRESGRGYAWTVVVLATGLSGVAQAFYLANGVTAAPAGLRFGVGAWPAIAAAIVAHLLFLIATAHRTTGSGSSAPVTNSESGFTPAGRGERLGVPRSDIPPLNGKCSTVQSVFEPLNTGQSAGVQTESSGVDSVLVSDGASSGAEQSLNGQHSVTRSVFEHPSQPSALDRAVRAAREFAARHGGLPTVTQLQGLANVSRGTASDALQPLRRQLPPPQSVTGDDPQEAQP